MTEHRKLAISSGYGLLLMALVAPFSLGYTLPVFYGEVEPDAFLKNIQTNRSLYITMMAALLLIIVLDVFVSFTLWYFFRADNAKAAINAFYLRMGYTALFVTANYFLLISFYEEDGYAVQRNYSLFDTIWSAGLIIFGMHLLLISRLMKIHIKVPRYLWYLPFIAGVSYMLVHLLKIAMPAFEYLTNTMNNILAIPMALGELGLAIWFILKGGK